MAKNLTVYKKVHGVAYKSIDVVTNKNTSLISTRIVEYRLKNIWKMYGTIQINNQNTWEREIM